MIRKNSNRLLREIILENHSESIDAITCSLAFRALSRRRMIRRLKLGAGACLLFSSLVFLFFYPAASKKSSSTVMNQSLVDGNLVSHTIGTQSAAKPLSAQNASMDDLLSQFPPGSCGITEVHGKTILVFRDEATREKYTAYKKMAGNVL